MFKCLNRDFNACVIMFYLPCSTYNFHRTKLVEETGRCEISSGKKRDPVPIADYMTSMRILESPTFSMGR